MDIYSCIKKIGLLPVIKLNNIALSETLAHSLVKGNLPAAEITYRADNADKVIYRMLTVYPDMLVGAGSVLNISQVDSAIHAGAKFIVMPGYNNQIIDYCLSKDIPVIPGCSTATEIMNALDYSLKVLKFFPAEQLGGLKTISAISAPFPGLKFIPTGGITLENLKMYLESPNVFACGGSYIAPETLLSDNNFEEITNRCKMTSEIISSIRR